MKPPDPAAELLAILRETRTLVALPGNDFVWTRWENAAEALAELDAFLADLHTGTLSQWCDLEMLFAPTGQLQELSMSSGWGERYLHLAARFDAVLGKS
ncbi:hypothetical protein [Verrucomicrobium sp. BvORR034]|uniref:hypothetical protein n=1 Tax=Verrucomicrobium sp. BvORR034 TaxID=1396418 RepID=UPI000B09DBA5|nr:hypothetical protein [Verrucomicrobium sp. BvORR034]